MSISYNSLAKGENSKTFNTVKNPARSYGRIECDKKFGNTTSKINNHQSATVAHKKMNTKAGKTSLLRDIIINDQNCDGENQREERKNHIFIPFIV